MENSSSFLTSIFKSSLSLVAFVCLDSLDICPFADSLEVEGGVDTQRRKFVCPAQHRSVNAVVVAKAWIASGREILALAAKMISNLYQLCVFDN